jgi:hypothetical protein
MQSKFRGPNSVRGNSVTTCVYYGKKNDFSEVTPFYLPVRLEYRYIESTIRHLAAGSGTANSESN